MFKNLLTPFSVLALALVVFGSASALAQADSIMVPLSGNISPALSRASLVGHRDPSSVMNVIIALKLRNTEQLQEFLQAVQDPTSSTYHQFLTPQQFNAMYGPTAEQAATVVEYLKQEGLNVTGVSSDNRLIHVRNTSGTLERAFGVRINDYTYHGRPVFGTPDEPKFPSAIAGSVQAVFGLSNIVRFHPAIVQSSGLVPDASSDPVGYSPQQIATAYNWPSITDTSFGTGVTIALLEFNAAGFSASDADTFWSDYELPSHTVTVTTPDGTPESDPKSNGEATLDVEWAGAMAPGAAITVYDGLVTSDPTGSNSFLGAMEDMLDGITSAGNAKVVSISYEAAEDSLPSGPTNEPGTWQAMHASFEATAAEDISVFASTGDYGSSDGVSGQNDVAGYPASDPYVVAAGGTSLTLNSNNTIASEVVWNDGNGSATGGAQSILFTMEPSWQVGNGVPQNGVRNTSDLSMDADPDTGYSVYEGGWLTPASGGTSFVAPQLAALVADWISIAGGEDMGAADPDIYADANSSNYSTDFHDITSGNNGAFSAGSGWDHPTGWGSINAAELLTHIDGGIALSAPQGLSAEYFGCSGNSEEYLVGWQAPQVGTPTGYDAEWEEPDEGIGWESIPSNKFIQGVQPNTVVNLRVRATNGTVTTPYDTDQFISQPCGPPPAPTGTGK